MEKDAQIQSKNPISFPYKTSWEDKLADYKLKDFDVHLLYQSQLKQKDYFIVFDGSNKNDNRIGMIFPVTRFDDDNYKEEKDSDQIFLESFMSVAREKLAQQHRINIDKYIEETELECITLSDFFSNIYFNKSKKIRENHVNNLALLVFINKNDFCIEERKLFFQLKYNFFFLNPESDLIFDDNFFKAIDSKNVVVPTMSQILKEESFIKTQLPDIFMKSHDNSFLCFSVLYQVVEFFIENLVQILIDDLLSQNLQTYDLKNNLNEKLSEKGRIKELFNKCVDVSNKDSIIANEVKLFKEWIKDENKSPDLPSQIYFIRNLLFHNLRSIIGEEKYEETLHSINKKLENIIVEMLHSYNHNSYTCK